MQRDYSYAPKPNSSFKPGNSKRVEKKIQDKPRTGSGRIFGEVSKIRLQQQIRMAEQVGCFCDLKKRLWSPIFPKGFHGRRFFQVVGAPVTKQPDPSWAHAYQPNPPTVLLCSEVAPSVRKCRGCSGPIALKISTPYDLVIRIKGTTGFMLQQDGPKIGPKKKPDFINKWGNTHFHPRSAPFITSQVPLKLFLLLTMCELSCFCTLQLGLLQEAVSC